MRQSIKLLVVLLSLFFISQSGYAQFSIKVGGNYPYMIKSDAECAKDFSQQQIGVYAGLYENISFWEQKREHTDHSMGISINADFMWNTWKTSYKQDMNKKYEILYPKSSVKHVHYMNIPIMIGFCYKLQNASHSAGMAIDVSAGCNLLYRIPLKVSYKESSVDYQYKLQYNLAYGVAAHAGISFLAGEHFSVGVHCHLLNIMNNSGSESTIKVSSGEEITRMEFEDKKVSLYPFAFTFAIGVVF